MKVLIVLATILVIGNAAAIVSDEDGDLFYLVPLQRVRRQTTYDISKTDAGTRATIGHTGTIFQNQNNHVTGTGFASKQFKPTGPLSVGGNVGYQHIPSGSGVNVGAEHTRHFGTSVNAGANLNLLNRNNGNTRLDATGDYSRHFGGPYGTGRPDYNAGLKFTHRF